jgi:outer membrane protein assembly factor BamB
MTFARLLAALALLATLPACSTFGGGKAEAEGAGADDGRISILTFEQQLEADPALVGQAPAIPPAQPVLEWSQPGGPASNAPPPAMGSPSLEVAWKQKIGNGGGRRSRISAPPIVVGDTIYVLNADHALKALDRTTGREIWAKSLTPSSGRDRVALAGGVAALDGRLFLTSGFGFIAAFDAASGEEIWRAPSATPFHAAPSAAGGRVFAVNNDSELVVFDAASGTQLWSHQAIAEPARILSSSSPAILGDVVVAPFASGQVIAFVPANGRRLWEDALTRAGRLTSLSAINDVSGRPVAIDGFIYAASHSGILAAIDQRTGQRVWARGLASTQTPFVAGDTLFIVTTDAELTAIERTTGRAFWVSKLRRYQNEDKKKGRISWTGPVMVGGKLVLASSVGQVAFVDPATGAVERSINIGTPVFIPPITAGGDVFILTDEGELVVLR